MLSIFERNLEEVLWLLFFKVGVIFSCKNGHSCHNYNDTCNIIKLRETLKKLGLDIQEFTLWGVVDDEFIKIPQKNTIIFD